MKTQHDYKYIEEKLASYREKFTEIKAQTNISKHPVWSKLVVQERYFQTEKSLITLTAILCKDAESAIQFSNEMYINKRENAIWGLLGNLVYEITGTNATEIIEIEHLANHLEGKNNFINEWKMKLLFGSYILSQQPDLTALQKIVPIGYTFVKAENDKWFFQDSNGLSIEINLYKGTSKVVLITFSEKKENEKLINGFLNESKDFQYWGSDHNTQYYKQLDRLRKYPNLYFNTDDTKHFEWFLNNEK